MRRQKGLRGHGRISIKHTGMTLVGEHHLGYLLALSLSLLPKDYLPAQL